MAAKGTRVTQREVKRMWELYQEGLTFVKIGKKMRSSPDTVAKYVHQYEAVLHAVTVTTEALT